MCLYKMCLFKFGTWFFIKDMAKIVKLFSINGYYGYISLNKFVRFC